MYLMTRIIIPKARQVNVAREGTRVALIVDGREVLAGEYTQFLELVKALYAQAKLAEEEANAQSIIYDQAILTRLGVPLGLSNNPVILQEAAKEAAWNTSLRRYIEPQRAGGIASQAVFGTPAIKKHRPKNPVKGG